MALPSVTLKGHLADDAVVKEINGSYVINYKVVSNAAKRDESGNWINDASPTGFPGSLWVNDQNLANENASLLKKGTGVLVSGQIRQRQYEADGQVKYIYELLTNDIGLTIKKTKRPE